MDRQPPAVYIVRLFTQQIEQLGVAEGDQEVKAVIRVAHNEEQGRFAVPQGVQLQLIVGRDLPYLRNIEHRQPSAAAHKDALGGLARA